MRYMIISALFLAAWPLHARDKVDVLVMNNGDRLTCEIKSLSSGALYVGLDYVQGTIQVDWSKVHHVESTQLFLVKTVDGSIYVGTLSTAQTEGARPMRIEIVEEDGNNVTVGPAEVAGINQTSENIWRRFNGAINSGFTYAKANQTTQYTVGANAQYIRERWNSGANFTSTLTSNTGVNASTRNNVQAYYRHLMRWNNWFYMGTGSLLQSTEQQIQLQSNLGGGIGRYLINTNRATINVFGGLGYQNTRYTATNTLPASQNTAAALVGVDAALFRFDKTNVSLTATALPALNQPGRIYNNVNAGYFVKFWGNFTWNLSFYGSWDNQPPLNFPGSDYGMTSGLGWTFGNYNGSSK
jgi:uncharacterized protein DUF481